MIPIIIWLLAVNALALSFESRLSAVSASSPQSEEDVQAAQTKFHRLKEAQDAALQAVKQGPPGESLEIGLEAVLKAPPVLFAVLTPSEGRPWVLRPQPSAELSILRLQPGITASVDGLSVRVSLTNKGPEQVTLQDCEVQSREKGVVSLKPNLMKQDEYCESKSMLVTILTDGLVIQLYSFPNKVKRHQYVQYVVEQERNRAIQQVDNRWTLEIYHEDLAPQILLPDPITGALRLGRNSFPTFSRLHKSRDIHKTAHVLLQTLPNGAVNVTTLSDASSVVLFSSGRLEKGMSILVAGVEKIELVQKESWIPWMDKKVVCRMQLTNSMRFKVEKQEPQIEVAKLSWMQRVKQRIRRFFAPKNEQLK